MARAELDSTALVAASPYPILALGEDGAIRSWNEAAGTLFGYEAAEIVGKPIDRLVPGLSERLPELFRRAGEEGSIEVDVRGATRAGDELELVLGLAPIRKDRGDAAGCAILQEVGTRRRAARRRSDSEVRYRLIVESAVDFAIFTLDLEGRVSSWNTGAQRLLRYTPEEILGREARVIFVPEDRLAGVPEREMEGARKDGVYTNERWHLRGDGERLWGSGLMMVMRDPDTGEVRGYLKILQDHTHRRLAEERLAKTLDQLLHSNEMLQRFAYTASHDLQEPIRTIGSFAQLLATRYRGQLDPDAEQALGFVVEAAERLDHRVRGLLDRARVQHVGPTESRVSLEEVLHTVLLDLGAHIRATGARIEHEPLPEVRGDPLLFGQLLQNLISNALKFGGDRPPYVHLRASDEGAMWRISVRDEGVGVDPADAERLFGMFARGVEASVGGTGVGLAISKRIVEMHYGRLWVDSRPGEGATFHFTLPKP